MQNTDVNQSFTAQLFVDNKPVALAGKVIQKLLEAPDITEKLRTVLEKMLEQSGNLLVSYGEDVIPDTFLFAYHDDVYTIKIADNNGQFSNTISMEGELRNLSVFEGDDPTYFRIINRLGESSKLDDFPDDLIESACTPAHNNERFIPTLDHPTSRYLPIIRIAADDLYSSNLKSSSAMSLCKAVQ